VEDCYEIAELRLFVARDYMESVSRLLEDPSSVYGSAALVRVLLECSARAWWDLDPSVDVRSRIARGLIERILSDMEGSRLPSSRLKTQGEEGVTERLDEARSLNFEVVFNRRGNLQSVDGLEVPSYSSLLESQLGEPGTWAYRVLSAVVHGSLYALISRSAVTKDSSWRHDLTLFSSHAESLITAVRLAA
jgi:hypothetical protein